MIVLFDCNSYDKLAELEPKDLQKIAKKITKVILPQAVKNQLDMMIGQQNKLEKLSKINKIIADLDIDGKIDPIDGMFGFASCNDIENGEIKKDKATQRKYYTISHS